MKTSNGDMTPKNSQLYFSQRHSFIAHANVFFLMMMAGKKLDAL